MRDGPRVYLSAVEGMLTMAEALLSATKLTWGDIDLVIAHQANRRILERIARLARISPDKVFINIERIGNISSASVPVALHQAIETGRMGLGQRALLLAAGAGHTAGAALYTHTTPAQKISANPVSTNPISAHTTPTSTGSSR